MRSGSISVLVRPWARVYIDGKLIQQTPLNDHVLSAGRHTIVLRNDELGKQEAIPVVIRSGFDRPNLSFYIVRLAGTQGVEVIMCLAMRGALGDSVVKLHHNYYLATTTAMTVALFEGAKR